MFALIDIGERAGSGLFNIRTVWEDVGWPEPVWEEKFTPERLILSVPIETEEKGTVNEDITNNQQLIIQNMINNPFITAPELSSIVGISLSKIKENISKLKTKGLLERVGPDKGGYWRINET